MIIRFDWTKTPRSHKNELNSWYAARLNLSVMQVSHPAYYVCVPHTNFMWLYLNICINVYTTSIQTYVLVWPIINTVVSYFHYLLVTDEMRCISDSNRDTFWIKDQFISNNRRQIFFSGLIREKDCVEWWLLPT